jgi:hypothetical protein
MRMGTDGLVARKIGPSGILPICFAGNKKRPVKRVFKKPLTASLTGGANHEIIKEKGICYDDRFCNKAITKKPNTFGNLKRQPAIGKRDEKRM